MDFLDASERPNPSFISMSILQTMDILKLGISWRIRNVDIIRVWGDPWINRDYNFFIETPCVDGLEYM